MGKKQKNNVCTKSNLGQDRDKMINEGNYEFSCHDDVTAFLEKEDPNYQLVNPCGSCGYDCIDPATGKKGHQWCYVHDDSDCSDMFFFIIIIMMIILKDIFLTTHVDTMGNKALLNLK